MSRLGKSLRNDSKNDSLNPLLNDSSDQFNNFDSELFDTFLILFAWLVIDRINVNFCFS